MSGIVYGIGVNDAEYKVKGAKRLSDGSVKYWSCPFYSAWKHMLARCYSKSLSVHRGAYKESKVCDEWLSFSSFKEWMERQIWDGRQLDKDCIFAGNKIYSPEKCSFILKKTNVFLVGYGRTHKGGLTGCLLEKSSGKFRAQCRNPFTGKNEQLGKFIKEIDAHKAWKKRKHELAIRLSELESDPRVRHALRTRFID